MKKIVFVVMMLMGFVATEVIAVDLSRMDCTSKKVRLLLMNDFNRVNYGIKILDLTRPNTICSSILPNKVICAYDAVFNDGDTKRLEITLTESSLGEIIVQPREVYLNLHNDCK